ncbi:hypothetical protein ACFL1G_02510 [Planctomycetota bacterium]
MDTSGGPNKVIATKAVIIITAAAASLLILLFIIVLQILGCGAVEDDFLDSSNARKASLVICSAISELTLTFDLSNNLFIFSAVFIF